MQLVQVVGELLELGAGGTPSARTVTDAFAPRATAVETGNRNLTYPRWAKGTRGTQDVFLTLDGDLEGLAIWEDSRGWGTYAELAVRRGTLAELQPLLGPTTPVPRNPGDFVSGEKLATYLQRGGKTVRVFLERGRPPHTETITRVTIHFQS